MKVGLPTFMPTADESMTVHTYAMKMAKAIFTGKPYHLIIKN